MHRACWEQHGGCPNADRHGEFTWKPSKTQSQTDGGFDEKKDLGTICPVCGANCAPELLTCPNCGAQLSSGSGGNNAERRGFVPDFSTNEGRINFFMNGVRADRNEEIDGAKIKDIAAYVQSNTAKIINKFKSMGGNKKVSWNWAAFFFSQYWFFYRKMYKIGAVLLAVQAALMIFQVQPSIEITDISEQYMVGYNDLIAEAEKEGMSQAEFDSRANTLYVEMFEQIDEHQSAVVKLAVAAGLTLIKGIVSALIAYSEYRKKVIDGVKKLRKIARDDNMFFALTVKNGGVSLPGFLLSFAVIQLVGTVFFYIAEM